MPFWLTDRHTALTSDTIASAIWPRRALAIFCHARIVNARKITSLSRSGLQIIGCQFDAACLASAKAVIFNWRLSVCLLATSRKNRWSDIRANFTRDEVLNQEVSIKTRTSSDSAVRIQTQDPYKIRLGGRKMGWEVCAVRVLLLVFVLCVINFVYIRPTAVYFRSTLAN